MRPGDVVTYQGSALDVEDNEDYLGMKGIVHQVDGDYCLVEMEDGTVIDGMTIEFNAPAKNPGESEGTLSEYMKACERAWKKWERRYPRERN